MTELERLDRMDSKKEIIKFFEKYIEEFRGSGGSGKDLSQPHFDITPRDFLDFAEKDLEQPDSTHSLVNATSNLKRAVDCQLDSFLMLLNLDNFYRKKRLGVDRKLGFLEKAGLFRSKSLEKLNKLRNRLEHHYEIPKIEDVEVYYDLVVAFVSVIEGAMPLVGHNSELDMELECGGSISTTYMSEKPSIKIELKHKETELRLCLTCDLSEADSNIEKLEEFAFFFKTHSLLRLYDEGISSSKHVLKMLNK